MSSNTTSSSASQTPPPPTLTRALSSGIDASNIGPAVTRALQEFSAVANGSESVQQLTITTLTSLISDSTSLSPVEKALLTQVITSFTPILLGLSSGTIATCEATLFTSFSAIVNCFMGCCKKKPNIAIHVPVPTTSS